MWPVSILDILTEAERWLDLHKLFGPLSGLEAKIDELRKRFPTMPFCYGCNLGPTQTARSVKNLSRKQVARLNLRHVTEERLDNYVDKHRGHQRPQPIHVAEILGFRQPRIRDVKDLAFHKADRRRGTARAVAVPPRPHQSARLVLAGSSAEGAAARFEHRFRF